MTKKKFENPIILMTIACAIGGFLLTRIAGSFPSFIGALFNLGSIVLFLFPIAYDLYIQKQDSRTSAAPLFKRDLLYRLLVTGCGLFLMLFAIRWLQGKPFALLETLNTAIILSFIVYIYQSYIKPRLPFNQKKDE